MTTANSRRLSQSILIALFICLALRLWTLEYPDLIDPTESRYAFIAQEMVLSGNWLTPKLPESGLIEPYDGKPPLHFWLTATSFLLFGMDEWVARLPSFLALLTMIGALWWLKKIDCFKESAPRSTLVLISSTLMYFMSGASVIDTTLAACTSVTIATLAHLFFGQLSKVLAGILLATALGLGFLTKGPIVIAIVGLAVFTYLAGTRNFAQLKKIPWLLSGTLFMIIVSPWFILAERANPGFIEYFFINENFKRYLFKQYGDRYGSGHRYPIGTIWLFLSVSFLPWTLFFIPQKLSPKIWWRSICAYAAKPEQLFILAWAISPLIIFTFAKQIHAGYLIPALPGLALICASLFEDEPNPIRKKLLFFLPWVITLISVGVVIVGAFWGISSLMLILSLPIVLAPCYLVYYSKNFSRMTFLALSAVIAYSLGVMTLSQGLGERKSAESILRCLTHFATEEQVTVGILDSNSYSLYFYSRAWKKELERGADVLFLDPQKLPEKLPNDIILRTKDIKELLPLLPVQYDTIITLERWTWVRRKEFPIVVSECPSDNS
jgi:4-amino-4-deoxy-L-arabinose transferase-like glycosyltransferase